MNSNSEEYTCMTDTIDRLASRHIAKLLARLDGTLAPIQISEIKRQIRFFADDVKTVNATTGASEHDEQFEKSGNF